MTLHEGSRSRNWKAVWGGLAIATVIAITLLTHPDQARNNPYPPSGPLPTPTTDIIPTPKPQPTKVEQNQSDQSGPIVVSLCVVGVVIGGL